MAKNSKNSVKLVISEFDYPALVESLYYGRLQIIDYIKNCLSPYIIYDSVSRRLDMHVHTVCSMARVKIASFDEASDIYSNLFNEKFWLNRASQLSLPF